MATGNQNIQPHVVGATLMGGASVDTVILTDGGFGVEVMNVSGTSPIYFTVSHPGGACPVPTVGGTNCYCAASVAGAAVRVRHSGQYGSVVQLISSGTPQYIVSVVGDNASM